MTVAEIVERPGAKSKSTVNRGRRDGVLVPAAADEKGRDLFRLADVRAAELFETNDVRKGGISETTTTANPPTTDRMRW